jgi:hypothetical protein
LRQEDVTAEPRSAARKIAKRKASATADRIDIPLSKPGWCRSAAGVETEIPVIHGAGAKEIREVRGEILRANIARALEGSHLHMKALFEYAGVWPAEGGTKEIHDDSSLAALLLKKLDGTSQTSKEQKTVAPDAIVAVRTNGDQR